MTHKNTYVLEKLLSLIDDNYNDIYIHVDKKCRDFNYNKYQQIVKKSKVYFLSDRVDIKWGEYSQVDAELKLLSCARKNKNYNYYHLLSGQDLPIKTVSEINDFLRMNKGKEFVDYRDLSKEDYFDIYNRVSVNHIFVRRHNYNFCKRKILGLCDAIYGLFQKKVLKRDFVIQKNINLNFGSQWFSITQYAADVLLQNQEEIKNTFRYSSVPDELFVPSTLSKNNVSMVGDNMRYILFNDESGHPYTWKKSDFDKLIHSDKLFARKFDEHVDKEIIDKLVAYLKERAENEIKRIR